MTHWLFVLLLLLPPLFGNAATAAAPDDDLARLHQIRLATQGSLSDLYLLYGDPDPSPAASIARRIASTDAHLTALGPLPEVSIQSLLAQLQGHWTSYQHLLSDLAREQQSEGNLDPRALSELIGRNRELLSLCDQLAAELQRTGRYPLSPSVQRTRALSLLMQDIASAYAAHSVGATALGGEGRALDELADEFNTRLEQLRKSAAPDTEYQRVMAGILHKWRYIEGPLRHHQKTSVPFLINQYSTKIIAGLEHLATLKS